MQNSMPSSYPMKKSKKVHKKLIDKTFAQRKKVKTKFFFHFFALTFFA